MASNKKCQCTLYQSLVGDGCRYCQPQEYIDRLQDTIKELYEDYDKLHAEKATIWHLKVDK